MLENGGNVDVALSLAQAARQSVPNAPGFADTLAWAYYHKGIYKLAIPLLQEALKSEPQNFLYHYHIGMVYEKTQDSSLARSHLRKALQANPKSAKTAVIRHELEALGS